MTRVRVSLNGDWDFHPLKEISPPEGPPETNAWQSRKLRIPSSWRWSIDLCAEYQPYNLFEYPPAWNDVQAGWIQRSFAAEIPTGKRAWLHFEAVLQRSVYFINGKRVYASTESTLPIEFDVTDHLQPGLNELAVWCGP